LAKLGGGIFGLASSLKLLMQKSLAERPVATSFGLQKG
jgi:hypothetical protein